MHVKTYEQIKHEQEEGIKQKRNVISDVLTSTKNNPKFAKLLIFNIR